MKKRILILAMGLIILAGCSPTKKVTSQKSNQNSDSSRSKKAVTTQKKETFIVTDEKNSLLNASENNNLDQVKKIISNKKYNLNEVNEKKETPLIIATHQNEIEIAKLLIDAGADINQQDETQDSAYLYAAAQGKTEILEYILKHSEPNQKIVNRFGGNGLIPAAEKGHLENVVLLLNDGRVNIDHQNNFGYTALIESVALRDGSKNYQNIVQTLLNYGANKNIKDNENMTAKDYAIKLGYEEILNYLK